MTMKVEEIREKSIAHIKEDIKFYYVSKARVGIGLNQGIS